MLAEERRRLELARLASELLADASVLESVARGCAQAQPKLRQSPDRALLCMLAVDLHRYFTAVENVLERVERVIGALPPVGPSWHKDLLVGASRELADARPAILSPAVIPDLEALLSFRHFFRHAYAVEFDAVRLDELAARLARVHGQVVADLHRFVAHLQAVVSGMRS